MPFIELHYLNASNDPCSAFLRVEDLQSIPNTVAIDSTVLTPNVTFTNGESTTIAVCNMAPFNVPGVTEICGSLDIYLVDSESGDVIGGGDSALEKYLDDSPCSSSSKGSEATDCSVETPSVLHASPTADSAKFLARLAAELEGFGACIVAYRSYGTPGLYRFDFRGTPNIVCACMVLLRKLAIQLAEEEEHITPCFDMPQDLDLPWCRLSFQVIHEAFGDEAAVQQRLMDTHNELLEVYDYIYEETVLTDLAVDSGVVVDSRYFATENPWTVLKQLLQHMSFPEPKQQAEPKQLQPQTQQQKQKQKQAEEQQRVEEQQKQEEQQAGGLPIPPSAVAL